MMERQLWVARANLVRLGPRVLVAASRRNRLHSLLRGLRW